jgi:hypothetical protein
MGHLFFAAWPERGEAPFLGVLFLLLTQLEEAV